MRYAPGLRAKFNAVILPVLGITFGLMVAADYRHEIRTVRAAHDMHTDPGGAASAIPAVIDPATTPEAAGRVTLAMHAGFALLIVAIVVLAVNVALSWFILRPLARIRDACADIERGRWYPAALPLSGDEVGDLTRAFEDLGLHLDAFVGQALQADRLATLALLARTLAAEVEPEVQCIGTSVGRLHGTPSPEVAEEARIIARSAASILAAVRGVDHGFQAAFGRTRSGARS